MGACYSKKASGGNKSYITAPMASTKLDDASRLARPTPYARTQNTNTDYAPKKIPPARHNTSLDSSDIKNLKNNFQSNIPRFHSSLPTPTTSTEKTVVNDNESLHVVNNNAIVNSQSNMSVNKSPKKAAANKPKNVISKSSPDNISPDKPRTPLRGSGIFRSFLGRGPRNSPDGQKGKVTNGRNSSGPSPSSKSPSRKGFNSRESLSDFDSGIGASLNDKAKPEDSDTVKDLEQLEFQEEFSPNINVHARSTSTPKSISDTKLAVKAPSYRRELNGKWSLDNQRFGPENSRLVSAQSGGSSPREKHSFKMHASDNIFSTYASYKGLLSYQKQSFKPSTPEDSKNLSKFNENEKTAPEPSSSIPNLKSRASSGSSSTFYIQTEKNSLEKKNPPVSPQKVMQASTDSDEKSDSAMSPPSDENREFLIDDEIADQPGLTFFGEPNSEDSEVQSLQSVMTELHALQLASSSKKRTDSVSSYSSRRGKNGDHRDSLILGSELGSSCSSIASDDLMLDYEKTLDGFPEGTVNEGLASPMRKNSEAEVDNVAPLKSAKKLEFEEKTNSNRKRLHRRASGTLSTHADRLDWRQRTVSLPLRPPRQMTVSEADDGGLKLDSSSYRLLCQDLNGVKTLLLRLKSVIQEAETINPFDQTNPNNLFYHSLAQTDFPSSLNLSVSKSDEKKTPDLATLYDENADLKRQVVLLQQQLEDKDKTIHLLQQQMTKYLNVRTIRNPGSPCSNAATQTERSHSLTGSLSSSLSAEDSIETLVSFRITKCGGRF